MGKQQTSFGGLVPYAARTLCSPQASGSSQVRGEELEGDDSCPPGPGHSLKGGAQAESSGNCPHWATSGRSLHTCELLDATDKNASLVR